MKLWIDDVRPAPEGYVWVKTTLDAIDIIDRYYPVLDEINIDHDAGDLASYGGDYIRVLDFLESNHYDDVPIHIHSMNPVGVQNMRRIIQKNGWKEV